MSATITKTSGTKRFGDFGYASVMDITNWDRLDGHPEKITREEFERGYAERSRLTLEEFHRYLKALPCDCGEEDCEGWQAIPMRTWKREQREVRRRQPEYVYFARLGDLIKIGVSRDPKDRARMLNAELLGACLGSRRLEQDLHEEFHFLRERGEWFRATPALIYRMEVLCGA